MAFGRLLDVAIGKLDFIGESAAYSYDYLSFKDYHIDVEIVRSILHEMNTAVITIYNIPPAVNDTINILSPVTIRAGYEDTGEEIVYSGIVAEIGYAKQGVDRITELFCISTTRSLVLREQNQTDYTPRHMAVMSQSFPTGYGYIKILEDFCGLSNLTLLYDKAVVAANIEVFNNEEPFSFQGTMHNLVKELDSLLTPKGWSVFIDNNECVLFSLAGNTPISTVILFPDNGLISVSKSKTQIKPRTVTLPRKKVAEAQIATMGDLRSDALDLQTRMINLRQKLSTYPLGSPITAENRNEALSIAQQAKRFQDKAFRVFPSSNWQAEEVIGSITNAVNSVVNNTKSITERPEVLNQFLMSRYFSGLGSIDVIIKRLEDMMVKAEQYKELAVKPDNTLQNHIDATVDLVNKILQIIPDAVKTLQDERLDATGNKDRRITYNSFNKKYYIELKDLMIRFLANCGNSSEVVQKSTDQLNKQTIAAKQLAIILGDYATINWLHLPLMINMNPQNFPYSYYGSVLNTNIVTSLSRFGNDSFYMSTSAEFMNSYIIGRGIDLLEKELQYIETRFSSALERLQGTNSSNGVAKLNNITYEVKPSHVMFTVEALYHPLARPNGIAVVPYGDWDNLPQNFYSSKMNGGNGQTLFLLIEAIKISLSNWQNPFNMIIEGSIPITDPLVVNERRIFNAGTQ